MPRSQYKTSTRRAKTIQLLQRPEPLLQHALGKGNGAEAQDKDFNIVIMNTFKDLKGDLNKCLNEDRESTIVK